MIFVRLDSNNNIMEIHNMPFDPVYGLKKTEAELLKEGALVDAIPKPENIEGKVAVLKFNPTDKTLFYEYEDVPLTGEALLQQKISQLEQQLKITQDAIDAILLG